MKSEIDILSARIRQLQRNMKLCQAPLRRYAGSPRHVREATRHYDKRKIRELVILNVGMNDCPWRNCRMCGLSTRAEKLSERQLLAQIERIADLPRLRDECIKSLYFSPYSFFSDREMSPAARTRVYQIIDAHPQIEYAVFMTRAPYIDVRKLAGLRNVLRRQKVIIWMGLETADPFISRYCIDKGYTLEDVEKASELMKKYDIRTGIWVLQKPPFLTEKEAINDAVQTIRKGLQNGYEIRLMPCEVMSFTITQALYDMKKYRPPYLWSVIEVIKSFFPEERMKIDVSGPHFERDWSVVPRQIHSSHIVTFPYNCPDCSQRALEAIIKYNQTKNTAVFGRLDCRCKTAWQRELKKKRAPLRERIIDDFRQVIAHIDERGFKFMVIDRRKGNSLLKLSVDEVLEKIAQIHKEKIALAYDAHAGFNIPENIELGELLRRLHKKISIDLFVIDERKQSNDFPFSPINICVTRSGVRKRKAIYEHKSHYVSEIPYEKDRIIEGYQDLLGDKFGRFRALLKRVKAKTLGEFFTELTTFILKAQLKGASHVRLRRVVFEKKTKAPQEVSHSVDVHRQHDIVYIGQHKISYSQETSSYLLERFSVLGEKPYFIIIPVRPEAYFRVEDEREA
ncbi:hypothetical protein ACFL5X_03280 [Candidatus Omnitrophota bacterium]